MSEDRYDFGIQPPGFFLEYLTEEELAELYEITGAPPYSVWCDTATDSILRRFKYLMHPPNQEQWDKWLGIVERVEDELEKRYKDEQAAK